MTISTWTLATRRLCPRCGQGKLFVSFLRVSPSCVRCGLDLSAQDSGDGGPTFGVFILCFLIPPLALWFEFHFDPPWYAHALLWPPLMLVLLWWLLPTIKAWLIAEQYRRTVWQAGQGDDYR